MLPSILMILGGLIWLTGELWGAYFDHREGGTTSEFVWRVQARWPIVKVLVGVFVASLFAHFLWQSPLLP